MHFRDAGNFHLIASDYPVPPLENVTEDATGWRLGQVPQWLNVKQSTKKWRDGRVELSIVHHANIFSPYNDTIFNSYAIESQFGHLDDISDNLCVIGFFYLVASDTCTLTVFIW